MRIYLTTLLCTTLLMLGCGQSETPAENSENGLLSSAVSNINLSSAEGSAVTKKKCASCHSLDRNIRKVGPSLKGIMGKAPTIKGTPFELWTEENMDRWLENPRSIKKSTRMSIPGIKDAKERKAIIAYLKLI